MSAMLDLALEYIVLVAAAVVGIGSIVKGARAFISEGTRLLRRGSDWVQEQVEQSRAQRIAGSGFPKLVEAVDEIRRELHPNGGASIRDVLDRVEKRLDDHIDQHDAVHEELTERLDEIGSNGQSHP